MSELLKIKLTIADRVYPLSVAPEQEEALRLSAKKIEANDQTVGTKLCGARQARCISNVCLTVTQHKSNKTAKMKKKVQPLIRLLWINSIK